MPKLKFEELRVRQVFSGLALVLSAGVVLVNISTQTVSAKQESLRGETSYRAVGENIRSQNGTQGTLEIKLSPTLEQLNGHIRD